jgi:UDP-galactopyranose mutase
MESLDAPLAGAGFADSARARRMAEEFGLSVMVTDRRPHAAGDTHDAVDQYGTVSHTYGAHISHTNAPRVPRLLSWSTEWRAYEHHMLAKVDARFVSLPVDWTAVQMLHGIEQHDELGSAHLNSLIETEARPENRVHYRPYEALCRALPVLLFVERLARCRLLNIDCVVSSGLVAVDRCAAGYNLAARVSERA